MGKDKRNQNEAILNMMTPRIPRRNYEPKFITKRSNAIDKLERVVDKIDVDEEFKLKIKKALLKL